MKKNVCKSTAMVKIIGKLFFDGIYFLGGPKNFRTDFIEELSFAALPQNDDIITSQCHKNSFGRFSSLLKEHNPSTDRSKSPPQLS